MTDDVRVVGIPEELEELVARYGEEHRALIDDALRWLRGRERAWGLDRPVDAGEYVAGLMARIARPGPGVAEAPAEIDPAFRRGDCG